MTKGKVKKRKIKTKNDKTEGLTKRENHKKKIPVRSVEQ